MEVKELGPLYFDERFESAIESIKDSANGLFIIIESKSESGKDMRLKLSFEMSMAYRYLDEVDLSYYWKTGLFSSRYHVYQILNGVGRMANLNRKVLWFLPTLVRIMNIS